jgi:hypothetical protein
MYDSHQYTTHHQAFHQEIAFIKLFVLLIQVSTKLLTDDFTLFRAFLIQETIL